MDESIAGTLFEIELIRKRGAPFVALGPASIEPGQAIEIELSGVGIRCDAIGKEAVGIDVKIEAAVAAEHVTCARVLVRFALNPGLEMQVLNDFLIEK